MSTCARRTFLKSAVAGAVATTVAPMVNAGSDRKIVVGVIGTGGMGTGHTKVLAARGKFWVFFAAKVGTITGAEGGVGVQVGKNKAGAR